MFLSCEVLARTRTEVINQITQANSYLNCSWSVKSNNILDLKNHKDNLTMNPAPDGQDGIDDRAYSWDTTNSKWIISVSNWPFRVNDNVTGEAYTWGQWDTSTDFDSKVKKTTEKWIAGKRDIDTLPTGYNGFTGLDCSGFVSRCLGISNHKSTNELQAISRNITPNEVKKGDLLFMDGHVVMVEDEMLTDGSVDIAHAGSWRYEKAEHIRRVISESTDYDIDNKGNLTLRYESTHSDIQHFPYTPFPIFSNFNLSGIIYDNTPEMSVYIRSGTSIDTSFIVMRVDGALVYPTITDISSGRDKKDVSVSYSQVVPLEEGPHSTSLYAQNALALEDTFNGSFTVDCTRPYVKKVTIGDKYTGEWVSDGQNLSFIKSGGAMPSGTYAVTVVFSEPVKNVSMYAGSICSIAMSSSEPDNNKKTWSGT